MLQRFASASLLIGTLLTTLVPTTGLAQHHGRNSGGERSFPSGSSARTGSYGGQTFPGGSRSYAPHGFSGGSRYTGAQSYVSPRGGEGGHGYLSGPNYYRGYVGGRAYGRPAYRGNYAGGVYLGYAVPYDSYPSYIYEPGYANQGYSYGPVLGQQACSEGSYDQYGTWIPGPYCYPNQQQYPPNYNSDQQQYLQPRRNFGPNQQQYWQQQQNYGPSQQPYPQQRYSQPQPNYDSNQPQGYNR